MLRRYAYISYNGAPLEAFEYEEEEDAPCLDIKDEADYESEFYNDDVRQWIFLGGHKVYETLLLRPST